MVSSVDGSNHVRNSDCKGAPGRLPDLTVDVIAAKMSLANSELSPSTRDLQAQNKLRAAVRGQIGNEAYVQELLGSKHVDPDERIAPFKRTLLSEAASKGSEAMIKMLLECGRVDPNSQDVLGQRPLTGAILARNRTQGRDDVREAVIRTLLGHEKVEPDFRDNEGRTPLSHAASGSSAVVVRTLLHRRVHANSQDKKGRTPLSYAAEHGHEAIVELLLRYDATEPDTQDRRGRSPLSYAANGRYTARGGCAAVVKMLLDHGANPDARDNEGRTPLSYAAFRDSSVIVTMLLEQGADPNTSDVNGRTPLAHAAGDRHILSMAWKITDERTQPSVVIATALLSHGADPNACDIKGRSSLSYAAGRHATAIVDLLLRNNRTNADLQDKLGRTPLSYAVCSGHHPIVRLLLDNERVDPDATDAGGRTPLSHAAQNCLKDATIPRMLLATNKVNPMSRDQNARTPMWWAIEVGSVELVEFFFDIGQAVAAIKDESTGRELLSHAARVGDKAVIDKLLSVGTAGLYSKDAHGVAPFMWAVEYGNHAIVDLLLGDRESHKDLQEYTGVEIDARYLAHWDYSCSQQHGEICKSSPIKNRLPHQIPDWIIDVEERCLVPGHTASRYMALSYVWLSASEGTTSSATERLMLTEERITQFQKPGFLQGQMFERLPHAVQDAIVLVQKCGERYLWVDCLCIVQDSESARDQVDNMGEIYSGAHLTIIAATTSGRLKTHKRAKNHHDTNRTTCELYETLLKSKWASRGWTFQEQMLSKRAIIFVDKCTFWDCQHCIWDRYNLTPASTPCVEVRKPYYETARRMSTNVVPDFGMYIENISLYNSREFTYPQDALSAISGVLTTLARSFPTGFISGLPCMFLDVALIWQPFSQAKRRYPKDGGSIAPSKHLPSWSWCGWQCPVDPFSLRSRINYIDEDGVTLHTATCATHRLVQWYTVDEDLQQKSRIENQPPTSVETGPIQPHRYWSLISCETTSAFLRIKNIRTPPKYTRLTQYCMRPPLHWPIYKLPRFAEKPKSYDICHLICLEDKNGEQAGVLRRMDSDRAEPGDLIELIAISTGIVHERDIVDEQGRAGPLYKKTLIRSDIASQPNANSFMDHGKSKVDEIRSSEYIG